MIGQLIGAVLTWVLDQFFGNKPKAGPSADEQLGQAKAELKAERATNEAHQTAARARTSADERMQDDGYDINADPFGYYRD